MLGLYVLQYETGLGREGDVRRGLLSGGTFESMHPSMLVPWFLTVDARVVWGVRSCIPRWLCMMVSDTRRLNRSIDAQTRPFGGCSRR